MDEVKKEPCLVCGSKYDVDPDHIRNRGSGGDDTPDNLWSLCRTHHILKTHLGIKKMIDTFPILGPELSKRGWHVVLEFGRWKLRRK